MSRVVLLLPLLLLACQNSQFRECESLIWQEFGERSALAGKTIEAFKSQEKICEKYKTPISKEAFNEGFQRGLRVFCSRETGFEFGKSGEVYSSTCPSTLENEFNAGFLRGRLAFLELEYRRFEDRFQESEERVWRKEREYLIEANENPDAARQGLDILESYKEEARSLMKQIKETRTEIKSIKRKISELKFI